MPKAPSQRGLSSAARLGEFVPNPTRENGVQESPQTFLNPKIKNNSSLNYAQSEAERISNRYV